MTCNSSNLKTSTRKHCHCGDSLVLATKFYHVNDSLSMVRVLTAYNEMVGCLDGEAQWQYLRVGNSAEYADKLRQRMQSECPDVLKALELLEIYSFDTTTTTTSAGR